MNADHANLKTHELSVHAPFDQIDLATVLPPGATAVQHLDCTGATIKKGDESYDVKFDSALRRKTSVMPPGPPG